MWIAKIKCLAIEVRAYIMRVILSQCRMLTVLMYPSPRSWWGPSNCFNTITNYWKRLVSLDKTENRLHWTGTSVFADSFAAPLDMSLWTFTHHCWTLWLANRGCAFFTTRIQVVRKPSWELSEYFYRLPSWP